ncbi:hypothetical protein M2349_002224 [Caldanaerobacter subterraneus subsp. tengcongensis MB4]|nr:DUF2500 domain-containing protein [Caldanaerobacter subterraneus]MCS3917083.1 hypothetical protein [Caldanaerobacter subterraneus subsp. tengcongensis MB4]
MGEKELYTIIKAWENEGIICYFITFEFETGDRQEFMVGADTYGYLVEGDVGKLTFQGKKFLSFERTSI